MEGTHSPSYLLVAKTGKNIQSLELLLLSVRTTEKESMGEDEALTA